MRKVDCGGEEERRNSESRKSAELKWNRRAGDAAGLGGGGRGWAEAGGSDGSRKFTPSTLIPARRPITWANKSPALAGIFPSGRNGQEVVD